MNVDNGNNGSREKRKSSIVVAYITIAVLVVGVIGASYAYFAANLATNATSNIYVRANTLDTISIPGAADLTLWLTQTNMAQKGSDTWVWSNNVSRTVSYTASNGGATQYCYDIIVDTTNNQATGQAAGTLKVQCDPSGTTNPASQTCGALDVTKAANGASNAICTKQKITAAAAGSQTNSYNCKIGFLNLTGTNQSTLAGKLIYQGKIRFQRVSC